MSSARYIIGDVFDTLATLPDDSVDLVFSSPPFLALRSYLPADDPNKAKEIGSEATPADFLDTLLDVVEACDRVLAPHGSLCFELGDTFAGSGGAGGDYNEGGLRDGQPMFKQRNDGGMYGNHGSRGGTKHNHDTRPVKLGGDAWPLPKSLCGIPTLFAWSLAYGRNLLRPERTTPRWRIRNVVVWARPNPPVGALGDKFRPATSYLTVACKSDKRWFDLDAVRGEPSEWMQKYSGTKFDRKKPKVSGHHGDLEGSREGFVPAGAPPLDYWEIPTQPYPGAHYATFPDKLVVKPVKAMCPQRVCQICGEPSRRITEASYEQTQATNNPSERTATAGVNGMDDERFAHGRANKHIETLGWTDCGCQIAAADDSDDCGLGDPTGRSSHRLPPRNTDRWRNGVVLDPFAGSGTALAVATGHGRDAIGIDIDSRNAELALERVGPLFLAVETLGDPQPAPPLDVDTEAV